MFKIYDKVHGVMVKNEKGSYEYENMKEVEFTIKLGVVFFNEIHCLNRRWSKRDFDIIRI